MNEVEQWWRARHVPQRRCVLRRRVIKVRRFDRHSMDVIPGQRHARKQARTQMREIAVRVLRGRDPFVDLNDVHLLPSKRLPGQRAEHQPGGVAATDRHDIASTHSHSGAYVGGDDRCRLAGDCIVVGVDFDLHAITPAGLGLLPIARVPTRLGSPGC